MNSDSPQTNNISQKRSGIYTTNTFEFNLKCVIFGIVMILFYWISTLSEKPNYLFFPLIFIVAYIAMAWYDYMYDCSKKLLSGNIGITSPLDSIFKPQYRNINIENVNASPNQEQIYRRNIYIFHAFIAMPLIMFVSYQAYQNDTRYRFIYSTVFAIALLGFLYHFMRLFFPRFSN